MGRTSEQACAMVVGNEFGPDRKAAPVVRLASEVKPYNVLELRDRLRPMEQDVLDRIDEAADVFRRLPRLPGLPKVHAMDDLLHLGISRDEMSRADEVMFRWLPQLRGPLRASVKYYVAKVSWRKAEKRDEWRRSRKRIAADLEEDISKLALYLAGLGGGDAKNSFPTWPKNDTSFD